MSRARREPVGLDVRTLDLGGGDLRDALTVAWGTAEGVVLGHAWDGVIWGRIANGALDLEGDRAEPERVGAVLRQATLMDLRLFSPERELRVWRDRAGLRACLVEEDASGTRFRATWDACYELIRWPERRPADGRFVVLEGLAGQRHAPPGQPVPRALEVRHYYERDERSGLLRLAEHRLLALRPWEAGR